MGPAPPLRLAAVSTHPRHDLVGQVLAALNDLGWVLASNAFSNLGLAVHFELSPRQVPRVMARLTALPMVLSDPSLAALTSLENTPAQDFPEGIAGSLHITFRHSEPDLHSEIPAVPG